jgi:hypothetical protein
MTDIERRSERMKQVTARKNARIRQLAQSNSYLKREMISLRNTVKILQAL